MNSQTKTPTELRASIRLTKNEIAHLWHGGILSLKVEAPDGEADFELRRSEVESERGTRILIKRVNTQ